MKYNKPCAKYHHVKPTGRPFDQVDSSIVCDVAVVVRQVNLPIPQGRASGAANLFAGSGRR